MIIISFTDKGISVESIHGIDAEKNNTEETLDKVRIMV
jgi:hypothetical protein